MKRIAIFLCGMAAAIGMAAQPNYKYILQHLDEMSDREVIYRLSDYQAWYPKKPHAYYLMGNIYFRLLQNEHSIADYNEKQHMIYNAVLYYGNCRVFLKNDHVKADMYPLAAQNGKVSEEQVTAWLTSRIDTLQEWKRDIESLYNAYTCLVSRYDTCQTLFAGFATRYRRMKGAQLMLDSVDTDALTRLRNTAALLPDDIARYKAALEKSPIPGYNPVFSLKPLSLYRIDGLTASDFLRNEVTLWNYTEWLDIFAEQQHAIERLRDELDTEQKRLSAGSTMQGPENRPLLNKINKYDEESPLISLLHLEYLTLSAEQLEQQLRNEMQSEETDWLIRLQLAYRLRNINREAEDDRYLTLKGSRPMQHLRLHFAGFMQTFFHDAADLDDSLNLLRDRRNAAWSSAQDMLTAAATEPVSIQIDDKTLAELDSESLTFKQISEEQ